MPSSWNIPTALPGRPLWVPPLRIAVKELLDSEEASLLPQRGGGVLPGAAARAGPSAGSPPSWTANHNRFHEENAGFFGFFETHRTIPPWPRRCLARPAIGCSTRGCTVFRGPVNPSTNYECGMLVDGFDSPPMVMMTYNPPYYPGLMEKAGFRKAKDLYAYLSSPTTVDARQGGAGGRPCACGRPAYGCGPST